MIGTIFKRLTILKVVYSTKNGHKYVLCKCSCGNEKVCRYSHVKSGVINSCGCLRRELNTSHGMRQSATYRIWSHIKGRCLNKTDKKYADYGGRGIKVCKSWMKFENFLKDMGDKSEGLSLDRKDNNKGYSKANCRWATLIEQANNKRNNRFFAYEGLTLTLPEWCRRLGLNLGLSRCRHYKLKWPIEKILTTPVNKSLTSSK